MTSVTSILTRVSAAGITLTANGDRLRFDAPHGLPPELRADLVEHKAEILALLASQPFADAAPSWDELKSLPWGPAVGDPSPGLDVHPPYRTPAGNPDRDHVPERPGVWSDPSCPAFLDDASLSVAWSEVQASNEEDRRSRLSR